MQIKRKARILIGTVTALALTAGPVLAEPVSLADAVSIGLARSPEIGQAQARVRAAEAGRDQAERQWMPQIEATGVYGWRHLENAPRINLGLSAVKTRPFYATISLNQSLWDFGRRQFAAKAQEGRMIAAGWEEQSTGEYAAYVIVRAYMQVRVQQMIVEGAEENLSFHRDLFADVGEAVDRGILTVAEKQQADERLQGAILALDQARAEWATARSELALLLGISEFDLQLPPDPEAKLPATLEDAMAVARINDPRLRSAEARVRTAQAGERRAWSEYAPQLGVQGTIRYGEDFEGYRGTTKDYELLLIARWTLFDGGINSARVREAKAGVDEARFALAQADRESELAIRKSWIAINDWKERLKIQRQRLKVARDLRISYVEQFGIGRRSLLDLLAAQSAVFSATSDVNVAQHGLWLAQYGLLGQMGGLRDFLGVTERKLSPKMYGPR
ncbi:MAG: TolC family protein [Novosphingobium sp.]